MALATRCPACETIFRITTAQAAAKSGMVRCGECLHAFDSLDALVRVEDLEASGAVSVPAQPANASSDAASNAASTATPFDDAQPASLATMAETAVVGHAIGGPPPVVSPAFEDDDEPMPALDPFDLPVRHDDGLADSLLADLASPDHRTVAAPFDAAAGDEPVREWWLPAEGEVLLTPVTDAEPLEAPPPVLGDQRIDLSWPKEREGAGPAFMRQADTPRTKRTRVERVVVGLLSLVALLALAGQAADHWRDEIAARWPVARPWLAAACARLGCRIEPPRHLESLTIESAGVQSGTPSSSLYVLTTLLRNRDDVAVRYPDLMLTLTNTRDEAVLRRVLRPEDYLAAGRDASTGFAPQSELPVRVQFELNDLAFVGYRLDRFYP